VNSRDVFIVKGDEAIHITDYADLEAWGNPTIEDVMENPATKIVEEFKAPKKKAAPKKVEPTPEPEAEPEPED
jgi:hypothetical protein